MKIYYLIIILIRASNGGVDIDHIEFDSEESCTKAANQINQIRRPTTLFESGIEGLRAICSPKGDK